MGMGQDLTARPKQYPFRLATTTDIEAAKQLLLTHGPNVWNYLPEDEVRAHLDGIATGETGALLALDGDQIVGMITFNVGNYFPEYEDAANRSKLRGYIAEAVVHREYSGKGLGSSLLKDALDALRQNHGVDTVYIKRHEENEGSAGMMRKAGFKIVDTFPDSIRTVGTKRTTVSRFRFTSGD